MNAYIGFNTYQHVLQSGVDMVILATPTGFRPLHYEAAVQASKHVFMEKALAVDAPGIRKLLAANQLAKRQSLKVGVGFQYRHQNTHVETVRRIHSNAIGTVRSMEAYSRRRDFRLGKRADNQSEMKYQMTNAVYFVWLGGDIIVDFLSHNLDICHWIKGGHPTHVRGRGGRKEWRGRDRGEVFDHFEVEYTYSDGTSLKADCSFSKFAETRIGETIRGDYGTAEPSTGRINGRTSWTYPGEPNNPWHDEHIPLIDAIHNDKPYNETEGGATSTMMAIMGRMAAYEEREITWDEAINSNEAYLPERYDLDADPPTLPDKFGDYVVPARGKRVSV